jgi:hypothetical protein
MQKNTYAEQLLDPRWQKKRLEILDYFNFQCEICGDDKSTLHVHHKRYIRGRKVWEYENKQLACLCKICHSNQHDSEHKFDELIGHIQLDGPNNKDDVYFLIAGFINYEVNISNAKEEKLYQIGNEISDWWVKK